MQDQGGWLNPEVAFWFENYARIVFQEFGDRVKVWITINEPWVVAIEGHSIGDMAPGMKGPGILEYKVAHNLIRSHAKAYRVYQNEFFASQGGIRGSFKNRFLKSIKPHDLGSILSTSYFYSFTLEGLYIIF